MCFCASLSMFLCVLSGIVIVFVRICLCLSICEPD